MKNNFICPREAAFLAFYYHEEKNVLLKDFFTKENLLKYLAFRGFISQGAENIHFASNKDQSLAKEIANGCVKRKISIKYLIEEMKIPLRLNKKEKALLYTAIYQLYFMDRVPSYAVVNDTVEIVKKYFSKEKAKFFNFFLRKFLKTKIALPKDDLSIKYSFPKDFVNILIEEYGRKIAEDILTAETNFFLPWARVRKILKSNPEKIDYDGRLKGKICEKDLDKYIYDNNYYIQNITPIYLIDYLTKSIFDVKRVLDLCSSPGGKALALMDLYEKADFSLNDISEKKIKILRENLDKYEKKAKIYISRGEDFLSEEKYDLIILDVPCTNSGVFSKRAEARWRFSYKNLADLKKLQYKLLENAKKLLDKNGYILYLTCSIVKEENEYLIKNFLERNADRLKLIKEKCILPKYINFQDGGYGALLKAL